MSALQAILVGILASMGFTALGKIYKKIVEPYLQSLWYSGAIIEGEWFAAPEKMSQNFRLEIKQKATHIEGLATFVAREDKTNGYFEDIRSFELSGEIRNRFVYIYGKSPDRSRIGAINFLLEIKGDGRQLVGYTSFYGMIQSAIVSESVVLTRDKAQPLNTRTFTFDQGGVLFKAHCIGLLKRPMEEKVAEDPNQRSLFDIDHIKEDGQTNTKTIDEFEPDDDLPF